METNCTRCNGLIIQDWCLVTTAWFSRCIQCGARPNIPRRDPEPHHLSKEKVGDLHTCRCGEPKVEWRMYCRICSRKKLNKEQRRKYALTGKGLKKHDFLRTLNANRRKDLVRDGVHTIPQEGM